MATLILTISHCYAIYWAVRQVIGRDCSQKFPTTMGIEGLKIFCEQSLPITCRTARYTYLISLFLIQTVRSRMVRIKSCNVVWEHRGEAGKRQFFNVALVGDSSSAFSHLNLNETLLSEVRHTLFMCTTRGIGLRFGTDQNAFAAQSGHQK